MRAIDRIIQSEAGESVDVDAHDVFDYDPDLYAKMVRYPLEVLVIFELVLMDMVARLDPSYQKHIQPRIFNLKSSVSMRNLNPSGTNICLIVYRNSVLSLLFQLLVIESSDLIRYREDGFSERHDYSM